MTTEAAAAAREHLIKIIEGCREDEWTATETADAILQHGYKRSLAPGKDVVEGARAEARRVIGRAFYGDADYVPDRESEPRQRVHVIEREITDALAAFATAHAAKEREACAKIAEDVYRDEMGETTAAAIARSETRPRRRRRSGN